VVIGDFSAFVLTTSDFNGILLIEIDHDDFRLAGSFSYVDVDAAFVTGQTDIHGQSFSGRCITIDQFANSLAVSTIGVIESVKADSYYALVAALGHDRGDEFRTTVALRAPFEVGSVQQYRMNSSVSVLETLIRELKGQPGMLQTDDGLPVPFAQLLTPAGFKYAEAPENLDRLWRMHADTFKPSPFDGTWMPSADAASTEIEVGVTAPEVTVIVAHKKQS
jgi:hypothetical protein